MGAATWNDGVASWFTRLTRPFHSGQPTGVQWLGLGKEPEGRRRRFVCRRTRDKRMPITCTRPRDSRGNESSCKLERGERKPSFHCMTCSARFLWRAYLRREAGWLAFRACLVEVLGELVNERAYRGVKEYFDRSVHCIC